MSAADAYYPLIITFLVLNSIVLGLRLYARVITKALGYDDALMVTAMVSSRCLVLQYTGISV